jgi:hypothetical protein
MARVPVVATTRSQRHQRRASLVAGRFWRGICLVVDGVVTKNWIVDIICENFIRVCIFYIFVISFANPGKVDFDLPKIRKFRVAETQILGYESYVTSLKCQCLCFCVCVCDIRTRPLIRRSPCFTAWLTA